MESAGGQDGGGILKSWRLEGGVKGQKVKGEGNSAIGGLQN